MTRFIILFLSEKKKLANILLLETMSPPPSVALLRQPMTAARSALRNWKPVVQHEHQGALLSFADFRRKVPSALEQKKEFGLGGGSVVDPVLKLFQ